MVNQTLWEIEKITLQKKWKITALSSYCRLCKAETLVSELSKTVNCVKCKSISNITCNQTKRVTLFYSISPNECKKCLKKRISTLTCEICNKTKKKVYFYTYSPAKCKKCISKRKKEIKKGVKMIDIPTRHKQQNKI